MFGQLVIFSDDNFENNIFFGVIKRADRNEMDKTQRYNYINIGIEIVKGNSEEREVQEIYKDLQNKNIVIVESKTYYVAYSHVLKCLQSITELPFSSIIVHGKAEDNIRPEMWNHDFV